MNTAHSLLMIAVISLLTVLIRFLPFIIFRDENSMPNPLKYLGGVLPGAVMGMLVIYCFRSTVITEWPFALPEAAATVVVALLYLWRRNTLVSIAVGTILYMFLVQCVF